MTDAEKTMKRVAFILSDGEVSKSPNGRLSAIVDLIFDTALVRCDGNVRAAAEYIGVNHQTFYNHLRKRGLK